VKAIFSAMLAIFSCCVDSGNHSGETRLMIDLLVDMIPLTFKLLFDHHCEQFTIPSTWPSTDWDNFGRLDKLTSISKDPRAGALFVDCFFGHRLNEHSEQLLNSIHLHACAHYEKKIHCFGIFVGNLGYLFPERVVFP